MGESLGLSGTAHPPLADFGSDSSATRRNLLVGDLIIALVLLAMPFGLGGYAFYLFHQSS